MSHSEKQVVVVGAGFGGIRAALDLDKLLPSDYAIVLIDRNNYHGPQPMLFEVAAAHVAEPVETDFLKARGAIAVPLAHVFKKTRVRIVRGEVSEFFFGEKKVALADGRRFSYSYLVMALGSETNYFAIDGMIENAFPVKNLNEALALRAEIEEVFARKEKNEFIRFIVGGGGFVGVEVAGELTFLLKELAQKYGRDVSRATITVVEGSPSILAGAKTWVQKKATARLQKLGVEVLTNGRITSCSAGRVVLGSGETMPVDILIWTAGIKAPAVIECLSGVPQIKGCLSLTPFLNLEQFKEVYGVGDLVASPVPATAQRALVQGKTAAKNIAHVIAGEPLARYSPVDPVFVVPVGGRYGLADLHGVHLVGFPAWCLKMIVELKYLVSILPIHKAMRHWLQGVQVYVSND